MTVRQYLPEDEKSLRNLHEKQGHDYELPSIDQFAGIVVVEDQGQVVQAVAARKTLEAFMLGDPNWGTPAWRMLAFNRAHYDLHLAMKASGYTDVNCWVPPSVERRFGRRLTEEFGWSPSRWKVFSKQL